MWPAYLREVLGLFPLPASSLAAMALSRATLGSKLNTWSKEKEEEQEEQVMGEEREEDDQEKEGKEVELLSP